MQVSQIQTPSALLCKTNINSDKYIFIKKHCTLFENLIVFDRLDVVSLKYFSHITVI